MVWNPKYVHYDQILSNISVGIKNEDMVGDVLFPTVPVSARAFQS